MTGANYPSPVGLRCTDLGCDIAGRPIVRGVSFDLEPGQALQLFGANGAGKSTILGTLSGRRSAASGSVEWVVGDPSADRKSQPHVGSVAVLDHVSALKPHLTIAENLEFWAAVYDRPRAAMNKALEQTGLAPRRDQRVSTLSAGQRRRAAFARLVMSERPVWLLDEPTASIDERGEKDITAMIAAHLDRAGIAVIVTHHPLALNSQQMRIG